MSQSSDETEVNSLTQKTKQPPNQLFFYALLVLTIPIYAWILIPELVESGVVNETLTEIYLAIWIALPILIYLDIRAVRNSDADWKPKTANWVIGSIIPLFNASVLIPYLLRRYERGFEMETWSYWWRIAGFGVAIPILGAIAEIALLEYIFPGNEALAGYIEPITLTSLMFTTALVPVSMKYDLDYIEPRVEWNPDRSIYIYLSAIWLLNFIVVLAYVLKRNPESSQTVIEEIHEPIEEQQNKQTGKEKQDLQGLIKDEKQEQTVSDPEIDSQWWVVPALTTALTILALVIAAAMAGLYLYYDQNTAYLLIWPLFPVILLIAVLGVVSIVAMYLDAEAINEANAEWRPSALLYLAAAVLTSPILVAVIYTIQRHRYLGEP